MNELLALFTRSSKLARAAADEAMSRHGVRVGQNLLLEVLWETELDAEVAKAHDWKRVVDKGFDEPKLFGAYLNTQRWNLVTSTNASNVRCGVAATRSATSTRDDTFSCAPRGP